ncbi:hypothetical protein D3C84_1048940 [compost metagenome]
MQLLEQPQAFASIGWDADHPHFHARLEFLAALGHVLGEGLFPGGQEQQTPAVGLFGHGATVIRSGLAGAVAEHVHGVANHAGIALVDLVEHQ